MSVNYYGELTFTSEEVELFCCFSLFCREKREKELNEFLRQRQNRVGLRIKQRIQSINDAMSSSNLELK